MITYRLSSTILSGKTFLKTLLASIIFLMPGIMSPLSQASEDEFKDTLRFITSLDANAVPEIKRQPEVGNLYQEVVSQLNDALPEGLTFRFSPQLLKEPKDTLWRNTRKLQLAFNEFESDSTRAADFYSSKKLTPELRKKMSKLAGKLADNKNFLLKDSLIKGYLSLYDINMSDYQPSDPYAYDTFNNFFSRGLKPGARPVNENPEAVISPVDGTISEQGTLRPDTMIQAKGFSYKMEDLLDNCDTCIAPFLNGEYVTLYLSPANYHRIHMPVTGLLKHIRLVPGDLFSVDDKPQHNVPGLYTRNQRMILFFKTAHGPLAMVLVGALNIGKIVTEWVTMTPETKSQDLEPPASQLNKGNEVGKFQFGSTVIMLFPKSSKPTLEGTIGETFKMGERIATYQ